MMVKACDALAVLAKKKGTPIETKILLSHNEGRGDDSDMVVGDGIRFRQVLMHLISNAIKFTPPNCHITVTVTTQSSSSPCDNLLRVEVTDTGT